VFFAGAGWKTCPCVERDQLGAGAVVAGPAIVEQLDATTVIPPGQRATVDRTGNLVVRAQGRGR
jgi:N-methylhydantoinase A